MKLFLSLLVAGVLMSASPLSAKDPAEILSTNALKNGKTFTDDKKEFVWYDGVDLTLFGKGFEDTPSYYSRLPKRAEKDVPPAVWNLSQNTAGIGLHFISDLNDISASWTNNAPMGHMAYSGSGGLDLYKKVDGQWVFAGVGVPGGKETTQSLVTFTKAKLDGKVHEYMLYLPLYSPVKYVKIGINKEAKIAPAPKRNDKPIVFYGTSITQGGCASRAGMAHPSILGRRLNKEVINLGFSGSGKSEPEMAQYISEIDAEMFVIEPVPNMTEELIKERSRNFIHILRKKYPQTPILMVMAPTVPDDNPSNLAYKAVYDSLIKDGDKNLYILSGANQFAGEEHPTVDGVHPTDLGFLRMADVYEPVLRKILGNKSSN